MKNNEFSGSILSSSSINSYNTYGFETGDIAEATSSSLSFKGIAGRGEDVVDFSVPDNSQLFSLTFN